MCFSLLLLSFSVHPALQLSLPPSVPGFLDAEQTQCSLREITRLINANKQTTALRQPQMKANLYAINKRRSSFNLLVCPARCSTPPSLPPSSASPSPPTPSPPARVLPISVLAVLLGRAQRQGKLTDASIIHRSPLLSLFFSLAPLPSSPQCSVYLQALCQSLWGGEFRVGKLCCSRSSLGVIGRKGEVLKRKEGSKAPVLASSLCPSPVFFGQILLTMCF